jgi:hypothetical protein
MRDSHLSACLMPLATGPPPPSNEESRNTCLQGPSSLRHGGCAKTHHDETCLGVALTDETSLLHTSLHEIFLLPIFHDEIPHGGTSLDETDPFVILHCDSLHDETSHGSPHSLPGQCFRYPFDED